MSSFMFQKSFHPTSQFNKKRKFIAEEKQKAEEKKQADLRKLRAQEQEELLKASTSLSAKQLSVSFLYQPPPGLPTPAQMKLEEKKKQEKAQEDALKPSYMKNAPSEGSYTKGLYVIPKPLGHVYKNVRCVRCRHWGHQSGERICPLINANPNDYFRQLIEDPVSSFSSHNLDLIDPHHTSVPETPLFRPNTQRRPEIVLKSSLSSQPSADDAFDLDGDKELEERAKMLLDHHLDFGDDEEGQMLASMSHEERLKLLKEIIIHQRLSALTPSDGDDEEQRLRKEKKKKKEKEKKEKKKKKKRKEKRERSDSEDEDRLDKHRNSSGKKRKRSSSSPSSLDTEYTDSSETITWHEKEEKKTTHSSLSFSKETPLHSFEIKVKIKVKVKVKIKIKIKIRVSTKKKKTRSSFSIKIKVKVKISFSSSSPPLKISSQIVSSPPPFLKHPFPLSSVLYKPL